MKTVISAKDIEQLLRNGGDVQGLLADAILTPSARDRLREMEGPASYKASASGATAASDKPVTSKSAKDTQGVLVSGIYGTELQPEVSARYGGQFSSNLFFRVYGKYSRQENFQDAHGRSMNDESEMGRGGFRLDWEPGQHNLLTFSADYYENTFGGHANDAAELFQPRQFCVGHWPFHFSI